MNFFDHKDLGNHLLQLCPKVVKHPVYRASQEECARLREGVPYVKLYRYNTKHLYPMFNFKDIMATEKSGLLAVPNTATCTANVSRDRANVLETGMQC